MAAVGGDGVAEPLGGGALGADGVEVDVDVVEVLQDQRVAAGGLRQNARKERGAEGGTIF